MAIPERTVRAMLATVRQAALAEDLPTTVEEAWTRFGHQADRAFTHENVVMELLRDELSQIVAAREKRANEPFRSAGLTAREREVLGWLATGLRDREIARELDVSTRTVSKHLGAIYRKLGVTTRAGAVAAATGRAIPPTNT